MTQSSDATGLPAAIPYLSPGAPCPRKDPPPRPDVVQAVRGAGRLLFRAKGRHETIRRRRLGQWLEARDLHPTLDELEAARHSMIREEKNRKRARLRVNQRTRRQERP